MAFTSRFQSLPAGIQSLLSYGIELLQPEEVILFGSRARGDFGPHSDYDVAFKAIRNSTEWKRFLVEAEERAFTLLKVDLVDFDRMSEDYRRSIRQDGVILYET